MALLLFANPAYAAKQVLTGLWSTGVAIYHEFASGHAGEAIGSILALALVFAITKKAADIVTPDAVPATAAPDAGSDAGRVEAGCGQSFTAGTRVVLASGKTTPIAALRPGAKVLAMNTRTGKDEPRRVAAVLVRRDTSLYDLTIRTGSKTAVIRTTSDHLFWEPATRHWVTAASLRRGAPLRAPGHHAVLATGGRSPKTTVGWMWDLTIPRDHDFYVTVAATAVLVHNDSPPRGGRSRSGSRSRWRRRSWSSASPRWQWPRTGWGRRCSGRWPADMAPAAAPTG